MVAYREEGASKVAEIDGAARAVELDREDCVDGSDYEEDQEGVVYCDPNNSHSQLTTLFC